MKLSRAAIGTAMIVITVVSLAVSANAQTYPAHPGDEARLASLTQQARIEAGLPGLIYSDELASVARIHSFEMADAGRIWHQENLATAVRDWETVGDNVGVGPSVEAIQDAFLRSPGHRANILDGGYRLFGVGAATDEHGRTYVTVIFMSPRHHAAAPAPRPVPRPKPLRAPVRTLGMLMTIESIDQGLAPR